MRLTGPLIKVLEVFLQEPDTELYGLQLLRTTGLKSGTVYPLLDRLEAVGWLQSRWEDRPASRGTGPRRRFYTLTATGAHEARQLLVEHGIAGGGWILT